MEQNIDLTKLSDSDKQELGQVLANEAQKSTIQSTVHHLNSLCWKKCISNPSSPSKITSGSLTKSEVTCAQNCIERWMDTTMATMAKLDNMRH